MRHWIYVEPVSGTSSVPVYHILSDDAVLDHYWNHWSTKMAGIGKFELINAENCIQDWATVHWAQVVTTELLGEIINGQ